MSLFAVQYFDNVPDVDRIPLRAVRTRLRSAFDCLPISMVLLGWHLPETLVDACAEECQRAGASLYRWQPLLTGDKTILPRPGWHTIGLSGRPIPGFQGIPEFTFVCPNRPAVKEAVLSRLQELLQDGRYQGFFLDRIRYPSPAADPVQALGCFCEDCQRVAASEGFDLEATRRRLFEFLSAGENLAPFVQTLFDAQPAAGQNADLDALRVFLDFRSRSVSRFVQDAADLIHGAGRSVGLDCFSPSLTRLVGQSLPTLNGWCDWIKIMSYGHAFGPATLPFELIALADWLMAHHVGEEEALAWLSEAAQLPLPHSRAALRQRGLSPQALGREVRQARQAGVSTLLAGIELVELEGVSELDTDQIAADLGALRSAGADGLVLSWDLWLIPAERLETVRGVWS